MLKVSAPIIAIVATVAATGFAKRMEGAVQSSLAPLNMRRASSGHTPQTNRSGENGHTRTIAKYAARKSKVTRARFANAKAPATSSVHAARTAIASSAGLRATLNERAKIA